jgi:hypothetical protein
MEWINVTEKKPPMDGTPFICFDPEICDNFEHAKIYVVRYEPETIYSKSGFIEAGGECYFMWEPKYWMPLPEDPKEE